MKNSIVKFLNSIDVPLVRFTKVGEECFLNEIKKEYIDKTAVVIAVPYYKTDLLVENLDKNKVYFSSSSWGNDYHKVLYSKLEELKNFLNLEGIIEVDTGFLDNKFLAYKSGIGFYGKNNLIINEEYGSYIFLGVLLIDEFIPFDDTVENKCLDCDLCLKACPSKALENGYDKEKCLSFINQKKGELTSLEKSLLNNVIYGCDKCSFVCPFNKNNKGIKDFKLKGKEIIDVFEYTPLSNKEFKEKYGELSGAWRGKKIIERNINIYKEKIK